MVAGCLFGNLALELSNQAEEIRSRLQEILEKQINLIEQVVIEAKGGVGTAAVRTGRASVTPSDGPGC
ncbi:TetR family transcriptional regulator C-terminal domain-containing protein [Micromonospora sp. DT201]|uniref:TetR family transcriptional regulator C-terminal domain-containing protein n=1 Tax=Micromonospora sp. DT201 TaxID=3393442 RepID=UPI003CED1C72